MATQMSDKETTEKCKMNPNVAAIQGRSNGTRAGSHWSEILAAVEDRSVQPPEFVRLILMEMSLACHELQTLSGHSSLEFKLKPLLAEIHALQTLAGTAGQLEEVAAQTDTVNLDGPKFYYVATELFEIFIKTADAAGCSQLTLDTIRRSLRNHLLPREPEIRRRIKEIVAFPEDTETPMWPKKPSNESTTNSPANAVAERPTT